MTDLDQLRRHLQGLGKVLLGYSGGVDSALLAVVGSQTLGAGAVPRGHRPQSFVSRGAVAERGRSGRAVRRAAARARHPRARGPALPPQRHRSLLLLQGGAVDPSRGGRPPPGFDTIIDGTNADDLGEHRPGLRAGREGRNPLAARGARLEQGGRAYGEPRAGPSHLGRAGRALSLQPGAIRSRASRPAGCGRWRTARRTSGKLGVAGDLRVRHHGRRRPHRSRARRDADVARSVGGGGALLHGARLRAGRARSRRGTDAAGC